MRPSPQGESAPALVTVTPERSPATGQGRIGVSLAPVTYIKHVKGATVQENLTIVNTEFARCGFLGGQSWGHAARRFPAAWRRPHVVCA